MHRSNFVYSQGTAADYVAINPWQCELAPVHVPLEQCALLAYDMSLLGCLVNEFAFRMPDLCGTSMLILGSGQQSFVSTATMMARLGNCRNVTVVVNSRRHEACVKALGASHTICLEDCGADYMDRLGKYEVVFDSLALTQSEIQQHMSLCAPGVGHYVTCMAPLDQFLLENAVAKPMASDGGSADAAMHGSRAVELEVSEGAQQRTAKMRRMSQGFAALNTRLKSVASQDAADAALLSDAELDPFRGGLRSDALKRTEKQLREWKKTLEQIGATKYAIQTHVLHLLLDALGEQYSYGGFASALENKRKEARIAVDKIFPLDRLLSENGFEYFLLNDRLLLGEHVGVSVDTEHGFQTPMFDESLDIPFPESKVYTLPPIEDFKQQWADVESTVSTDRTLYNPNVSEKMGWK